MDESMDSADIGDKSTFCRAIVIRMGSDIRQALPYKITGFAQFSMVGDRLYTDIAAGKNNGLTGILVLSGEATLDLPKPIPRIRFSNALIYMVLE